MCARLLSGRGDAFDAGADGAELFFDALVAAIDVVDAVDPGGVVGDQGGENERALARRSDAVTGAPLSGVGPVTMARLPSTTMLAPMRIISLACR